MLDLGPLELALLLKHVASHNARDEQAAWQSLVESGLAGDKGLTIIGRGFAERVQRMVNAELRKVFFS